MWRLFCHCLVLIASFFGSSCRQCFGIVAMLRNCGYLNLYFFSFFLCGRRFGSRRSWFESQWQRRWIQISMKVRCWRPYFIFLENLFSIQRADDINTTSPQRLSNAIKATLYKRYVPAGYPLIYVIFVSNIHVNKG